MMLRMKTLWPTLSLALLVLAPCHRVMGAAAVEAAAAKEVAFMDLAFAVKQPKQIELEGAAVPQPAYNDQIPERVRELNGTRVRIRGFMIPTMLEDEGVREFIIVATPMMCCYGQTPEIYEYMMVKMTGEKPSPMRENLATIYEGVLRVGDVYEHGYWTGILELECDTVVAE